MTAMLCVLWEKGNEGVQSHGNIFTVSQVCW
jgi:hypothetical protein